MPPPEPMAEPFSDAAALSDDEAALLERVVAGVARGPEAEPAIRELIESLLAKRIAELHAANASLEREVQERRMIELALRESEMRLPRPGAHHGRLAVGGRRERPLHRPARTG